MQREEKIKAFHKMKDERLITQLIDDFIYDYLKTIYIYVSTSICRWWPLRKNVLIPKPSLCLHKIWSFSTLFHLAWKSRHTRIWVVNNLSDYYIIYTYIYIYISVKLGKCLIEQIIKFHCSFLCVKKKSKWKKKCENYFIHVYRR